MDEQFDKDVRNNVLEGFAKSLRSEIREKEPLRYFSLLKEGRLTDFLAHWEDSYTSTICDLVTADHATSGARSNSWKKLIDMAMIDLEFWTSI